MLASTTMTSPILSLYPTHCLYASLHPLAPDGSDFLAEYRVNELTYDGYARQEVTWVQDGIVLTASVTFSVPAGTAVGGIGLWSVDTGGELHDVAEVYPEEVFDEAQDVVISLMVEVS